MKYYKWKHHVGGYSSDTVILLGVEFKSLPDTYFARYVIERDGTFNKKFGYHIPRLHHVDEIYDMVEMADKDLFIAML